MTVFIYHRKPRLCVGFSGNGGDLLHFTRVHGNTVKLILLKRACSVALRCSPNSSRSAAAFSRISLRSLDWQVNRRPLCSVSLLWLRNLSLAQGWSHFIPVRYLSWISQQFWAVDGLLETTGKVRGPRRLGWLLLSAAWISCIWYFIFFYFLSY